MKCKNGFNLWSYIKSDKILIRKNKVCFNTFINNYLAFIQF